MPDGTQVIITWWPISLEVGGILITNILILKMLCIEIDKATFLIQFTNLLRLLGILKLVSVIKQKIGIFDISNGHPCNIITPAS